MTRVLTLLLIAGVVIFAWFHADHREMKPAFTFSALNIAEVLKKNPEGTPPRSEREYKFLIHGPSDTLKNNSYLLAIMKQGIEEALLSNFAWQAPKFLNAAYSIGQAGFGTFYFLDIYLDSPDKLNEKWNISHRVRYRWRSRGCLERYFLGEDSPENFPHRCEFQVKTDRKEEVEGLSSSNETRFEFRNESFPFKRDNSAPAAPWPFEEFIPPAIYGNYRDFFNYPTFEYCRYLNKVEPNRKTVQLAPSLLLITARRRIHLSLPNPWGIAAGQQGMGASSNSDQVMIITLDTSEIYSPGLLNLYFFARTAKRKNSLTKRLLRRLKDEMIKPLGRFTEVEFEFERNVEAALHIEMAISSAASETMRLQEIERAFLSDQKTISKVICQALSKVGLTGTPSNISKYRKALQIIKK